MVLTPCCYLWRKELSTGYALGEVTSDKGEQESVSEFEKLSAISKKGSV